MIDKDLLKQMQDFYAPIISSMICANSKFYRTNQTIRWQFGFDERVAIMAWCDRKTNIVTVNIASVDFACLRNEIIAIEYYLLHEIRHIYQHMEIEDYKNNPENCNNLDLAKKWCEEEQKYCSAVDKDGNENPEYFNQDMELDAFAYSFAVIKYKYGELPYIYVPKAYETDKFYSIVNDWLTTFKEEGL